MSGTPCESCHEMTPAEELALCPVCGRGTCKACQCFDREGHFAICLVCAEGYQSLVRQKPYRSQDKGKAQGGAQPE
jgi:hypothetical protein